MMPNRITRPEARVLAEEEFTRFADLVSSLSPQEWATPTDCTGWDVRKMVLARPRARATPRRRSGSSPTSSGGACRSTRRSTRTTGSTA